MRQAREKGRIGSVALAAPSPARPPGLGTPGCGGGFWQKRRPLLCLLSFAGPNLVGQKAVPIAATATKDDFSLRCVPRFVRYVTDKMCEIL
jgi:hypothetical protein